MMLMDFFISNSLAFSGWLRLECNYETGTFRLIKNGEYPIREEFVIDQVDLARFIKVLQKFQAEFPTSPRQTE